MSDDFDPAALMSLESSLGDDSEIVPAAEDDLRRVAGAEVRRKCAGLKLAARIVGMATAAGQVDDGQVLHSMQTVMNRLSVMRQAALRAVGVDKASADYPAAFNSVTNSVMDLLTEEWKWGRVGQRVRLLSVDDVGKLLEMAAANGPLYLSAEDGVDLKTLRRLCLLEAVPKLWGVVNMFDYYQPRRETVVSRLARAVSEQAEAHAGALYTEASPTFAIRSIVQRLYGISAGLMCEVYKDTARADVERLRDMPDLDRAVVLAEVERRGMKYEHIIDRHRAVMDRTLDTTKLILEAQGTPRRYPEHSYAA